MSSSSLGGHPIFQQWSGRTQAWGPDDRYAASFAGDVLEGVTSGLDEFLTSSRRGASAVLGCTPWLTDSPIVDRLLRFSDSCVVINKPNSQPDAIQNEFRQIQRLHSQGRGLFLDSLRGFDMLAPKVGGKPLLVGPYSGKPERDLFKSVRVAGVRGSRGAAPLVHAKMLLVGVVHYSDEHPEGYVEETWQFEPRRLWFGSANFTYNSRRSIEFGTWVDDAALLGQALNFLTDLLSFSEPLVSTSVDPDPELVIYDEDEEAMWEAWRDTRYD
jgi:hypothetical protein